MKYEDILIIIFSVLFFYMLAAPIIASIYCDKYDKVNGFELVAFTIFFPIIIVVYLVLGAFKILAAFVKILRQIFEDFDNSLEEKDD